MLDLLRLWPAWLPWQPILASSIFFGGAVIVLGLLYVVGGILTDERRPLARFISLDIASWLATGLVVGLAPCVACSADLHRYYVGL